MAELTNEEKQIKDKITSIENRMDFYENELNKLKKERSFLINSLRSISNEEVATKYIEVPNSNEIFHDCGIIKMNPNK
jgi:predicted nuclease with TOPRIM domain